MHTVTAAHTHNISASVPSRFWDGNLSSEETVKIINQCPCWWVNGGKRNLLWNTLHKWGRIFQPGTVLPGWHLPPADLPLTPAGESGDDGEECSAACNVLQPVRFGSGSVRDWGQTPPPSSARYQDETLWLWYVWKAKQQGSLGQLLNSEEQSKFNEGSFLICSQIRERHYIYIYIYKPALQSNE